MRRFLIFLMFRIEIQPGDIATQERYEQACREAERLVLARADTDKEYVLGTDQVDHDLETLTESAYERLSKAAAVQLQSH